MLILDTSFTSFSCESLSHFSQIQRLFSPGMIDHCTIFSKHKCSFFLSLLFYKCLEEMGIFNVSVHQWLSRRFNVFWFSKLGFDNLRNFCSGLLKISLCCKVSCPLFSGAWMFQPIWKRFSVINLEYLLNQNVLSSIIFTHIKHGFLSYLKREKVNDAY